MDISTPITLFVDTINFEPQKIPQPHQRKSAIDVELRATTANLLLEELTEHMKQAQPGTIRIRFTGRLFL